MVYECLGFGVWHIGPIHWRASLGDGEWFIKDTPAEAECGKVFSEIRQAWPVLDGMSRLQPRVGLYIADDTWLDAWNPRWTGFLQDAWVRHWQVSLVSDAMLSAELAARTPVLISIDNRFVSKEARRGLFEYIEAGGRLFVWGGFAEQDELTRPLSPGTLAPGAHPRVVALEFPAEGQQRTLVNQFQTGDGAWQWPHTYTPVPVDKVEKGVLAHLPATDLRPVHVDQAGGDGPIHAFTLTDGISLLTVLVNMSDSTEQVKLVPTLTQDAETEEWVGENAVDGKRLEGGGYSVETDLAPYGTRLVWFHPAATRQRAEQTVARAAAAVDRWRELGADVSPFEKLCATARAQAGDARLASKAYCLARRVLGSLAIALEPSTGEERQRFVMKARVYNSNGDPVRGAQVYARIAPGNLRQHRFTEESDGYMLSLTQPDFPPFYDPFAKAYFRGMGPVRFVLTAQSGTASGGAMLVMALPWRPALAHGEH